MTKRTHESGHPDTVARVTTTNDAVTATREGDIAVIRLDDGKANALNHEIIDTLDEAIREAEQSASAIVLLGRPGRFSGGFDLSVMTAGPDAALPLLKAGADLAMHIYTADVPVVIGCTGHAVAMGAILLMAADTRIGASGEFKIGLNEVAIGMPVPRFAVGLARDRLSPRHLVPAVQHARLHDPSTAIEVGFLDQVVGADDVETASIAHASELGSSLQSTAFRMTRETLRGHTKAALADAIAADVANG